MRFTKLLKSDLRNGFYGKYVHFLVLIIMVTFSCTELHIRIRQHYSALESVPVSTYFDYVCYLMGGIKEYVVSPTEPFALPIKWLLLHAVLLYGTLYYPYRDLHSIGVSVLPRSGSRIRWWISKCIWMMTYQVCAYLVIFLTAGVFCLVSGGEFSLQVTPELLRDLSGIKLESEIISEQFALMMLFLPILVTISLNLLQMWLMLYIKPIFSFGISVTIMTSSAYLFSLFLIGTYAMPVRSIYIVKRGFTIGEGACACVVLAVLAFMGGIRKFKKYDVLSQG